MDIKYKLKQEDFVNFNLNYINENGSLKRKTFLMRVIGPCVFMAFAAITSMKSDKSSTYWYIIFGGLSIVWFALYPRFFAKTVKQNMEKAFKRKENEKLLQEKHIVLSEEGMIEKNNKDNLVKWSDFQSFKNLDDYIYIHISEIDAYILPKRDLAEEEIEEVLRICSEKIGG